MDVINGETLDDLKFVVLSIVPVIRSMQKEGRNTNLIINPLTRNVDKCFLFDTVEPRVANNLHSPVTRNFLLIFLNIRV